MTRRIDIELTSDRGDGTWTWRAPGAKQPKGTLDAKTLFDGASVGDVCRADADFALDGIFIEAVLPPKGRSGKTDAETIAVSGGAFEGGVTTTWKERKGGRGGRDGDSGRNRGGRDGGRGRARGGEGDGQRKEGGRDGGRGRARGGEGDGQRKEGGRDGGRGRERGRSQGRDGGGRGGAARNDRNQRGPGHDDRPKPKKLRTGRAHRTAWIDTLPEEQKIIADTLSRGGMQSVRKEIDTQNEKAKADGSPAIEGDPLLALAESLLPKLRLAEWRDRADAALADINEIDLRDLRSVVVAAADAAKDEETRALATQLRDGLNTRVEAAQTEWVTEISTTLVDGRVVRALRLSSRPPKAGALLPGDLLQRLTDAANEAVKGNVTQQRLATILDAVSRSVVRPNFVLESVPEEPDDELLQMVKKTASQLPEIAAKFGVTATRRPHRGAKKASTKRPPKPTGSPEPSAKKPVGEVTEAPAPEGAAEVTEVEPAEEVVAQEPVAEESAAEETVTEEPAAEQLPEEEPVGEVTEAPAPEGAAEVTEVERDR